MPGISSHDRDASSATRDNSGGQETSPPSRDPASVASSADLQRLAASRFLSLTTYRRNGTAVATPVWTVRDGSYLLVWTGRNTGKAKRLRHTGRVTVAECNARGEVRGAPVSGTARLLPDGELARVERLLAAKYRLGFPLMRTLSRVQGFVRRRGERPTHVGIDIAVD